MPGPKAPEEERREQILGAAHNVALKSGIDGVTLRAVAAEAGLSHGLVVFYFKRKDLLIDAVLDRALMNTAQLHIPGEVARIAHPTDRLSALVQEELARQVRDPRGMRLFFEYWAMGVRQPAIRLRVSAALERYRAAFRAVAEEMLAHEAPLGTQLNADGLAAVAVSLINGFAVQAMLDPEGFDTEAYLAAVQGLVEGVGSEG